MRPLCVHHDDADGFCAALAAWLRHGDAWEYLPADHGDPKPPVTQLVNRDVVVLDFSWRRPEMLAIASLAKSLLVLDHHKTAAADLAGLPFAVFDTDKAGCVMAWEHFHPGGALPRLFAYVQDRDLWRWAMPESRELSAGLASHPREFALWASFVADWGLGAANGLIADGKAVLRYQARLVEEHVKRARPVRIDGVDVPAVNATVLQSEIGHVLCQGKPFAAVWEDGPGGKRTWHLRSDGVGFPDAADVSAVAEAHGGGGHRRAAGFREWLPRPEPKPLPTKAAPGCTAEGGRALRAPPRAPRATGPLRVLPQRGGPVLRRGAVRERAGQRLRELGAEGAADARGRAARERALVRLRVRVLSSKEGAARMKRRVSFSWPSELTSWKAWLFHRWPWCSDGWRGWRLCGVNVERKEAPGA